MEFFTTSEAETEKVAEKFAAVLAGGTVVALCGEMGAGKTVFVRGLARGIGYTGRVTSPTYTIVNEYPTQPPLMHFDLYRLSSADELFEIGFDDYLARGGVCAVEWFENAEDAYTWDYRVELCAVQGNDAARRIEITRKDGAF